MSLVYFQKVTIILLSYQTLTVKVYSHKNFIYNKNYFTILLIIKIYTNTFNII